MESLQNETNTAYEVKIAGVPLRLRSSQDETVVNELVELVDQKIYEALKLTRTGSIQNAAILAALNLAEEYLSLKRNTRKELDRLEMMTERIVSGLEASQEVEKES